MNKHNTYIVHDPSTKCLTLVSQIEHFSSVNFYYFSRSAECWICVKTDRFRYVSTYVLYIIPVRYVFMGYEYSICGVILQLKLKPDTDREIWDVRTHLTLQSSDDEFHVFQQSAHSFRIMRSSSEWSNVQWSMIVPNHKHTLCAVYAAKCFFIKWLTTSFTIVSPSSQFLSLLSDFKPIKPTLHKRPPVIIVASWLSITT